MVKKYKSESLGGGLSASARRRAPRGPGRGGLGEYWVYIAAVISGPATAGPGSQVTKGFRHGRFLTPGFTPLKLKLKQQQTGPRAHKKSMAPSSKVTSTPSAATFQNRRYFGCQLCISGLVSERHYDPRRKLPRNSSDYLAFIKMRSDVERHFMKNIFILL